MKYFKLNFAFLLFVVLFNSCSALRELKEDNVRRGIIKENQGKIEVGMSKDEVTQFLGTPCNVQFEEKNEALQYCYTTAYNDKLMNNHYVVVWLSDGVVTGMTTYNDISSDFCINGFHSVYWENSHGYLIEKRSWR